MDTLTIRRPDDWHVHLRDGALMAGAVAHSARAFARAIIMPNLRPPITTVEEALAYRARILAALPDGTEFSPLMTLYLTDGTPRAEIERAAASSHVHGAKLYPAGATTNSASGITDPRALEPVLSAMQDHGLNLLVHGESIDPRVDVFDREAVFLEQDLAWIVDRFPDLRVVLEHVTTEEGVAFVEKAGPNVGATLTAHHLLLNRNALFEGGMRPHAYCLPVPKRERHRQALVRAVSSGHPRFFLGTDSAPHPRSAKERDGGCAGIYTGHAAMELYAEAFEQAGALGRLEAFASHHGPDFYGLPRNGGKLTLVRTPHVIPQSYSLGGEEVVPLRAGGKTHWSLPA